MITGITGKASFICKKCGTVYSLKGDDFDFNAESGSERGMGNEIQYISEHEIECAVCDQKIMLTFEVWEYPVGVINYTTHTASGASKVKSEFHFVHSSDAAAEETNTRIVGAAAGGAILGASLGGPVGAIIGGIVGGIFGNSVNKSKKGGGNNG